MDAICRRLIEGNIELEKKRTKRDKKMDNFIRHYLAMDGDFPTFNKLYITFKEFVDKNAMNQEAFIWIMKKLMQFSEYYSKFLYPKNEKEKELRIIFREI